MFRRSLFLTLAFLFTLTLQSRAEEKEGLFPLEDSIVICLPFEGKIQIWNYETKNLLGEIQIGKHDKNDTNSRWNAGYHKILISPDRQYIVRFEAQKFDVYNFRTLEKVCRRENGAIEIKRVWFSSDSQTVFFGANDPWPHDRTLRAYSVQTGKMLAEYRWKDGTSVEICQKTLDDYIFIDGKLWNYRDNSIKDVSEAALAISPNGKYLWQKRKGSGSSFIVEKESGKVLLEKATNGCAFLPDNRFIYLADWNKHTGFIFNPETKENFPLETLYGDFKVTTDGKYAIFADGNVLYFLDLKTGKVLPDKVWEFGSEIYGFDVGPAKATLEAEAAKVRAEKETAEKAKAEAEAKAKAEAEAKTKAEKEAKLAKEKAEKETKLVEKLTEGYEFFTEGEPELAIEAFAKTAKFAPKDFRAPAALALVQLYGQKDRAAAFETMKTFMKDVKDDPVLFNNFGVLAMLNNDYSTALTSFRFAAKVKPDAPELVQNVGLLMDLHKKKRAKFSENQTKRLIILNADTVKKHPDDFDPQGPYRFMPITNSKDHAKPFTQLKAGKRKSDIQPCEWWK